MATIRKAFYFDIQTGECGVGGIKVKGIDFIFVDRVLFILEICTTFFWGDNRYVALAKLIGDQGEL